MKPVYVVRVNAAVEMLVGPFDDLDEAIKYAVDTRSAVIPIFEPNISARQLIQYSLSELGEALDKI